MELHFSRDIEVPMPARDLWRLLREALRDSAASPVWPHSLSRLRLGRDGETLEATYIVGPLHRTVHYRLIDVREGESFSYEALADHPFEGGATVSVVALDGASVLHWEGTYSFPVTGLVPALFFRLGYRDRFFAALEARLQHQARTRRRRIRRTRGAVSRAHERRP